MKEIELTQGQVAIVDDDDYEYLSQWKWCASYSHGFYAVRYKNIKMHRVICKAPRNMSVDHINHNTLDNRKSNLRICTHQENMRNQISTIGAKGIRKRKSGNYEARISGKYLGVFENKIDAVNAYNKKAIELFGEFANLNFPPIDRQDDVSCTQC